MAARHFVLNENALVYTMEKTNFLGVLAGSIFRGGPGRLIGTLPPPLPCDTLREATLTDFETFRVCPEGHIPTETESNATYGMF